MKSPPIHAPSQNRWLLLPLSFVIAALLFIPFWAGARTTSAVEWETKVDPTLLLMVQGDNVTEIEFIVEMDTQADLSQLDPGWNRESKGEFVTGRLMAAAESQASLRNHLDDAGVDYRSFWVTNAVWISGPPELIPDLAGRPDVRYLYPNLPIPQANPKLAPPADQRQTQANEWGIDKINAPLLWAEGITGSEVIIAGQDTGYQWDHPALKARYRGWDANTQTADHNYSWHDAISSDLSGNGTNTRCGYSSNVPCDDHGHGTHTMGTMNGGTGGNGNQIGVAPGAQWIGCRNMEEGWGTPATYIDCFQWFMAPTDLNGQYADPSQAPHVINNSWGCPPSEGCNSGNFAVMEQVVDNLRAAGIAVVVSAGNSGSSCATVSSPAAIFDSSITIGATNSADAIASFSSRGPVTVDGSGRLKPDLTAPGVSVYSAYINNGYATLQGTSMAAPHVAGAIALLISAVPEAAGHVDLLEKALAETAVPLTTSQGCGGDTPASVPNHVFGAGRIDVFAARNWLQTQLELHIDGPALVLDPTPTGPLTTPVTISLHFTRNHGLTTTHPVTAAVSLPTNTAFISASMPFSLDGGTINWALTTLPVGVSETVTLSVRLSTTADLPVYTMNFEDNAVWSPGSPRTSRPFTVTIRRAPHQLFLPLIKQK